MAQVTEREILEALSKVNDPELGRDLVSLQMIKEVKVEGSAVAVTVELTTPACPLRAQMQQSVEQALRAVPGVDEIKVTMTAKVKSAAKATADLLPQVKHVILVGAGKGGVGKSTCAVNLALALNRCGATVGLLDADFYGPSVHMMLGVSKPPASPDGNTLDPVSVQGIKAISLGLLIDPKQAVIWRGPMLHNMLQQLFRDVNWGALDYLLIDLPPGTGDVPLSVTQQIRASGAVLVTTPQDISLADVIKAKIMFDRLNIPILGMVENMSNFICPHCRQSTPIFDTGGGQRACDNLGIPFLGAIPLDLAVRLGGDQGVPVVASHPDSPQAKAFVEMAQKVAGQISRIAAK